MISFLFFCDLIPSYVYIYIYYNRVVYIFLENLIEPRVFQRYPRSFAKCIVNIQCIRIPEILWIVRPLLAISATKKTDQAVASKPVARKYRRIAATRSTDPLLKDRTGGNCGLVDELRRASRILRDSSTFEETYSLNFFFISWSETQYVWVIFHCKKFRIMAPITDSFQKNTTLPRINLFYQWKYMFAQFFSHTNAII